MENRSRSHRRCPARTLGGKCLSNATYWMLVIHHGGELQLNAFLMPACLTGSLSLLQYTVDAPLHLNAMKCKGSALWTLVEGGEPDKSKTTDQSDHQRGAVSGQNYPLLPFPPPRTPIIYGSTLSAIKLWKRQVAALITSSQQACQHSSSLSTTLRYHRTCQTQL